ncbi:MAG: hypothetical protein NT002_01255 [candidate division Zixibacteria bacterium]|nr:hypothetical protein [candidate division Zixibacteria bacterium]
MKDLKKFSIFLTPAGAGIAIICFFLPWVKVSCGTVTVEASGARIGGIFWAVLAAAIIIMLSFFFFWKRKELIKARLVTLIGAVFSVAVMLYKFIDAFGGSPSNINVSDIGGVLRIGAFGSFAGFLLSVLGTAFMIDEKEIKPKPRVGQESCTPDNDLRSKLK